MVDSLDWLTTDEKKKASNGPDVALAMPTIYRQLDEAKREIRLIRVKAGGPDDPVHCEILYGLLREGSSRSYETISYVWGDASIRGTIYIENCRLDVPASSERVLRRLRLHTQDRVLWLDSVCINQTDLVERNQQVAMMGKIYRNSTMNLIWLGDSYPGVERAISTIDSILRDASQETDDYRRFFRTVYDSATAVPAYSQDGLKVTIDYQPLLRFFASDWFTRLWVVQEAALAPHSVCYYGDFQVPLLDVLRTATWLSYKRLHLPFRYSFQTGIMNSKLVWQFADSEHGPYSKSNHGKSIWLNSFLPLLNSLQPFKASESRDHVFALVGLYQFTRLGQPVSLLIAPDYRKSLGDVFRDATRFAIEERSDLDCLNLISRRTGWSWVNGTVSSWAIPVDEHWTSTVDPNRFRYSFTSYGTHLFHDVSHNTAYRGSSGRTLATSGVTVDVGCRIIARISLQDQIAEWRQVAVDGTDEAIRDVMRSTTASVIEVWLQAFEDTIEALYGFGFDDDHSLEVIANTLIAATDLYGRPISIPIATEGYRAWIAHLKTHRSFPRGSTDASNVSEVTYHNSQKAAEYHTAFEDSSLERSIFLTDSGRLGIGPKVMDSRDVIAILWGCRWPVVLRRVPEQAEFIVIGTAYVQGIMEGEAVREHEAAGKPEEVFYLL